MSMTERLVAITENDCQKLISDPTLTESFLYPENEDIDKIGEKCLNLDKTWNIIHFFLSGMVDVGENVDKPQNATIIGGREIGSELVYGPACIMNKEEVKNVFTYLKKLPKTFIQDKFNAKEIIENEIYPYAGNYSIEDLEEEAENEIKYIDVVFKKLIEFYLFAAKNNFSVIQVLE